MGALQISDVKCVGCGICVGTCPYDALRLEDDLAVVSEEICTLCGACVDSCPYEAIVLLKESFEAESIEDYSGICVYAEHRFQKLSSVVPEIVGAARRLKESLGKTVSAILIGDDLSGMQEELLSYGVDEVWTVTDPRITDFAEDVHAEVVSQILREKRPEIFLGGGTIVGRSLLPRVAVKIPTGLTADCTELEIDPETKLLKQTRPAFGGNIMATILTRNHRPQMATVRHKVMKAAERVSPDHLGKIVPMDFVRVPDPRIEVLEFVKEDTETVNIADADIIVSAGRGIKDPKNLPVVQSLARAMGGALGASRAAVDSGWIAYSHQVGQTGKTVNPVIYVACGISGAIQHLAGMKSSDIIVAINSDMHAPIFDVAHFGIVGDLFEVIPEMVKQIQGGN